MAPKSHDTEAKPVWHPPTIQELGNLRDFVRAGTGKSGMSMDNGSITCEAMSGLGMAGC